MSDVVSLLIEKSMFVCDYDFKLVYYPESAECKVSFKATSEIAGYDLHAAEDKEILPKTSAIASLDLRIAIPKEFFGKIFSRSGLFQHHKITAEAGVIDSGFRGIVQVLLFNHSDKNFLRKKRRYDCTDGFLEKFDVKFEMVQSVDLLPKSERNENRFGSTGVF